MGQRSDRRQRSLVEPCLVLQALAWFVLAKGHWVVGRWLAVGLCMQFSAAGALFQVSYSTRGEMGCEMLTSPAVINAVESYVFSLLTQPYESEKDIELAPANTIGTFLATRYNEVEDLVLFLLAETTAFENAPDSGHTDTHACPLICVKHSVKRIDIAVWNIGGREQVLH